MIPDPDYPILYYYKDANSKKSKPVWGSKMKLTFGETEAFATGFTGVTFLFFINLGKEKELFRFAYSEIDHFVFDKKNKNTLFYKDGRKLVIAINTKKSAEECYNILLSRGLVEAAE